MPPNDEIKKRVTADVDDAVRDFERVANAEGEMADQTRKVGDEAETTSSKFSQQTSEIEGMITRFASLAAVIGGVREIYAGYTRDLQENAQAARDAAQATLDLHALSLKFSPEDEAFIGQMAELGGRSRQEMGQTFTGFKSATAFMAPEEQRSFFEEMVVVPGMGTSGGIDALSTFAARASSTIKDPVALRNLQALMV